MKNILITGAHGFIGKNLTEYLEGKFRIFSPSHQQLDLLDEYKVEKFIKRNRIQIIIHCANVGGNRDTIDISNSVSKNLRMFFSIVRNLDHLEKVISLGSGAEYDKSRPLVKIKEEEFDKYIPKDDYGFAKYVCSKFIENSSKIVQLRLFGVFGKYENFNYRFISNAIVKNLLKLPIIINQNVYFDFLYIDDLTRIIEYFIRKKSRHKSYNATCGKTIDLLTVAKKINKISNFLSPIRISHKGLNYEYSGSNSRLMKEIPHLKFTPFDQSLENLYKWYGSIIAKIDRKKIKEDQYFKYTKYTKNINQVTQSKSQRNFLSPTG